MLLYLTSLKTNPIPQCERASGSSNYSKQRAPEPVFTTTSQKINAGELVPGVFVSFTPADIAVYFQNSGLDPGLDSSPLKSGVFGLDGGGRGFFQTYQQSE